MWLIRHHQISFQCSQSCKQLYTLTIHIYDASSATTSLYKFESCNHSNVTTFRFGAATILRDYKQRCERKKRCDWLMWSRDQRRHGVSCLTHENIKQGCGQPSCKPELKTNANSKRMMMKGKNVVKSTTS